MPEASLTGRAAKAMPRSPRARSGCEPPGGRPGPGLDEHGSAHDVLEGLAEFLGLVGGQLDHETAAALQWDPHDDSASLLGHFERTVSRPRLHRRHACI